MRCLVCMSKSPTRLDRPKGIEWMFVWLVWPAHCNRCLKGFYAPTLFLLPTVLKSSLQAMERELKKPKRKG
ncbi:MAG: hypothetical protein JSS27_07030 [Planctomycetes bacterium]|nr:hypothetical protein [Planctomycetota bacterium]